MNWLLTMAFLVTTCKAQLERTNLEEIGSGQLENSHGDLPVIIFDDASNRKSFDWTPRTAACIIGYNNLILESIKSLGDCKVHCQDENSFVCNSVEYHHSGRCILSEKTSISLNYQQPCQIVGWYFSELRGVDPDFTCDPPDFSIPAGTQYGCPCSYFKGTPTNESMPGRQCCQRSACPNSKFTSLHVCARGDGQACSSDEDALKFARQAWTDTAAIVKPYLFSCQGISYDLDVTMCNMQGYTLGWECKIQSGVVTECTKGWDNCAINSNVNDGSIRNTTIRCVWK